MGMMIKQQIVYCVKPRVINVQNMRWPRARYIWRRPWAMVIFQNAWVWVLECGEHSGTNKVIITRVDIQCCPQRKSRNGVNEQPQLLYVK
jgi:hypothetical protein